MISDLVKDAATRAAFDSNDGDWANNPFRYFRGVVVDKTFTTPVVASVLPVQTAFKPEVIVPLFISPSTSKLTIQYDRSSVGSIVISLDAPGRVVLLVGRFDSQVTGQGVK
jgi:hypothetical protein